MHTVPRSDKAEMAVLGACLIEPEAVHMLNGLKPGDFHDGYNGRIFKAIQDVSQRGEVPDIITVSNALGDESFTGLMKLVENTPNAAHVEHYAHEVQASAVRRRLVQLGAQIVQIATDLSCEYPVAEAQGLLGGLMDPGSEDEIVDAKEFWSRYLDDYVTRSERSNIIPTGFHDLDRLIYGLESEKYYVIAGRPGMGKSALAQQIAENVAESGKRVLFVSAEMGNRELADRTVVRKVGISKRSVNEGRDLERVTQLAGMMADGNLMYLDSPSVTTMKIRSHLKRLQAKSPVDVLILDYMQLCRDGEGQSMTEYQEVTLISKRLQAIKKEFKIPVIVVSQLNRGVEGRSNKRPLLSELRSSGQIEQDADVVIFVYRDAYYNEQNVVDGAFGPEDDVKLEQAEIIVAKHRGGPTGTVLLHFMKQAAGFYGRHPEQSSYNQ